MPDIGLNDHDHSLLVYFQAWFTIYHSSWKSTTMMLEFHRLKEKTTLSTVKHTLEQSAGVLADIQRR